MRGRINVPMPVVWAGAVVAGAAVLSLAGVGIHSLASGSRSSSRPSATATAAPSDTATVSPSATSTIAVTATTAPAAVPTSPAAQQASPPTATPDLAAQPSIEVLSVDPALGTHIETASVNIAINVRYQAGRDSNVLGWSILYCASPNDCNTYGFQNSVDIAPGSEGSVTLGAPFAAGGNYLRPIVLCQYTVEIGHFITPEARWQSQLANDPRCHPEVSSPRIKVLDVKPELGAAIRAGDVVRVNVEYDAGPATRAQVRYAVEQCAGDLFAARSVEVEPGTSGIATIEVAVTAKTTGTLRNIEAQLLNGDLPVASYAFGPC